jgi:protoporphyrin/coproporphyrin ferrochelatase
LSSTKYDAFLLVSFGGPEGMEEVLPFLRNVLRGRDVPEQRILAVAQHYELFGGISPINEQNRRLISALSSVIEFDGPKLPIYWGNRNWHPLLTDTVKQMADDGIRRAMAFVTAGYSSYSSCRQYLENVEQACNAAGPDAPQIEKIRPFYNHPDFIATNADNLRYALNSLPQHNRQDAEIIFTAHSIPESMADGCRYVEQLQETASLIIAEAELTNKWQLAYQSRSGSPSQPWLGPDINLCIKELGQIKVKNVVIAPIGFISDHIEILYDLDTEAKQLCEKLGIGYIRAKTAGTHPKFISMIKKLVEEKIAICEENSPSPNNEFCFSGCCPKG